MGHWITMSKSQCPTEPQDVEHMKLISYASAIETIMYAMMCIRPDMSYALSMTSQYQSIQVKVTR
jgi:ATP-binding cassette subfamily B (MDR/TAP) protein 1